MAARLVQMPSLVAAAELPRLHERTLGSTPDRMVRELAKLLERLGEQYLVILALEDLQWSDPSTLALIAALARRRDPARLLVAVTHRTGDGDGSGRSFEALAHDLELRGQCRVIALRVLTAAGLEQLVGGRAPGLRLASEWTAGIRDRTGGNPLFAEALVDYWQSSGAVRLENGCWQTAGTPDALRRGVPETLRAMIQRKLEALAADDEELLECASVIGPQFSSRLLGAIAKRDPEEVERRCAVLVRAALLREDEVETWPDGPGVAHYRFGHALYQEVLYERVPQARRVRLHLAIGRCLEQASGARTGERAPELAHHFGAGRDPVSTVRYLRAAAEQALGRSAHREAAAYLRRAIELLPGLPDGPARRQTEFRLHALLAPTALALEGFASPEVERSFARARELGMAEGIAGALLPLLYGRAMMHELRGEYSATEAVLNERLEWRGQGDESALVDSEPLMACSTFHQGRFAAALDHAENGARLYDPSRHLGLIAGYGENPGVACLGWAALALWFLGRPDRAVHRIVAAVQLGEAPGHLFSLSGARTHGAHLHQLRRDVAQTCVWATAAREVSDAQGYPYNAAFATVLQGWVLARQGAVEEGLARMQAGLDRLEAISAHLDRPYLLSLLAEVQMDARRFEAAAATMDEAFARVRRSRAFFYEAELCRLQAALVRRAGGSPAETETWLRRSRVLARAQQARSLELRAVTDLAELLMRRGAGSDARRLLRPVYRSFDEGFDTADLTRAARVLDGAIDPA